MRLLATLIALSLALVSTSILAHHRGDTLPGVPTTVMKRAMDRGYVTYRFDVNATAYPNFRVQAQDVAFEGDLALGIPAFEVTEGKPDIWLTMPDDQTFVETCGSGAAACVTYAADPIFIFFRRALGYSDWKTAIAHEGINYGHVFGEHEQYDDINFRCRSEEELDRDGPGPTVMSCGTSYWKPQAFDVRVVRSLVMPKELTSAVLVNDNFVWYAGSDLVTTKRLAVYFMTYTGYLYWSGYYVEPAPNCQNAWNVCGGSPIPDPGRCQGVFLGAENSLRGSWFDGWTYAGWSNCF